MREGVCGLTESVAVRKLELTAWRGSPIMESRANLFISRPVWRGVGRMDLSEVAVWAS